MKKLPLVKAELTKIEESSPNLAKFFFRVYDAKRNPLKFNFSPGQAATLALTGTERLTEFAQKNKAENLKIPGLILREDKGAVLRQYSICSIPDYTLELWIGLVENGGTLPPDEAGKRLGALTRELWDRKEGLEHYLLGEEDGQGFRLGKGNFVLPDNGKAGIYVGASTGGAPIISHIRANFSYNSEEKKYSAPENGQRRMVFVHVCSRFGDFLSYHDEMAELEKLNPNFTYIPMTTGIKTEEDIKNLKQAGFDVLSSEAEVYGSNIPAMLYRGKIILRMYAEGLFVNREQGNWLKRMPAGELSLLMQNRNTGTMIERIFNSLNPIPISSDMAYMMYCGNENLGSNMKRIANALGLDYIQESW